MSIMYMLLEGVCKRICFSAAVRSLLLLILPPPLPILLLPLLPLHPSPSPLLLFLLFLPPPPPFDWLAVFHLQLLQAILSIAV